MAKLDQHLLQRTSWMDVFTGGAASNVQKPPRLVQQPPRKLMMLTLVLTEWNSSIPYVSVFLSLFRFKVFIGTPFCPNKTRTFSSKIRALHNLPTYIAENVYFLQPYCIKSAICKKNLIPNPQNVWNLKSSNISMINHLDQTSANCSYSFMLGWCGIADERFNSIHICNVNQFIFLVPRSAITKRSMLTNCSSLFHKRAGLQK